MAVDPERLPHSATRLWFPPGVAPFGELNLVRRDHFHEGEEQGLMVSALDTMGPAIVCEAWRNSQWLKRAGGEAASRALQDIPNPVSTAIDNSITRAALWPNRQTAWFAVTPFPKRSASGLEMLPGLGDFIVAGQVVGYADAKYEVSGNLAARAAKRLFVKDKIYAAVSNVDVRQKNQGKKIGVALLFASLGMFRPNKHTTLYIPADNPTLIEKSKELGYKRTGSRPRANLIPGVTLEEVRLEAPTAKGVRLRLAQLFPWLVEARVAPRSHA